VGRRGAGASQRGKPGKRFRHKRTRAERMEREDYKDDVEEEMDDVEEEMDNVEEEMDKRRPAVPQLPAARLSRYCILMLRV
jgi:hypothetical protein